MFRRIFSKRNHHEDGPDGPQAESLEPRVLYSAAPMSEAPAENLSDYMTEHIAPASLPSSGEQAIQQETQAVQIHTESHSEDLTELSAAGLARLLADLVAAE